MTEQGILRTNIYRPMRTDLYIVSHVRWIIQISAEYAFDFTKTAFILRLAYSPSTIECELHTVEDKFWNFY